MAKLDNLFEELVTANRILAREGVVDSFGHVSARHPDNPKHFFLSRARAPDCIETDDIMEFTLEGEPVDARGRAPYLERFIHGGVYEARPDVNSVVHNHSPSVIPFGVTDQQAQAAPAHVRQYRPRGADLGFARQVRRHRAAGRERGHGPRPRARDRPAPHHPDARPRRDRRRARTSAMRCSSRSISR